MSEDRHASNFDEEELHALHFVNKGKEHDVQRPPTSASMHSFFLHKYWKAEFFYLLRPMRLGLNEFSERINS